MSLRHWYSLPTLALQLAVAPPLAAQSRPDSTRLPAVVITADRLPRSLGSTTAAVTVLDGAALRSAGVTHLLDALRTVPGATVARAGSYGAQTSLFLRGGESDFVRVLVDGVPMNDAGGAIDLAAFTIDNVDRIEIVRGPASVLYGSDAVTGVVQIFTRRAEGPAEDRVSARGGSYGTSIVDATAGARRGRTSVSAGLARHASDGTLAFNSDYRNQIGSFRGETYLLGETRLVLSMRGTDDTHHYPTDGSGNVVDRNAQNTDRRLSATAELSRALGARAEGIISVSALDLRGRTSDPQDGASDTVGFHAYRAIGVSRRRVVDARLNVAPWAGQIATLGTEWSLEAQRSTDSSNYDVSANHFSATRRTKAVYAQLVGDKGRVSYTVGGRYDDNDVYGSFRTARAGLAVRIWPGARIRAALGSAFKAPSFLETFSTAFSVGNAGLRPERSRSWEAGFAQRLADGRIELSASWFDQRFRDLIQYTFVSPTTPNYFNIAAASSRGLEAEVRTHLLNGVGIWANATALRTRVEDSGFESTPEATFVRGERLLRRPPFTASIGTTLDRLPRTRLDFSALRVAARDDRDFSSFPARVVSLDGYTRIDVGAEQRLPDSGPALRAITLTLRVENATGASYSEVQGFPAPGRVILAGVRVGTMR